jgi:hypothetical protein
MLRWLLKLIIDFCILLFQCIKLCNKHNKPLFVLVQTPPALPVLNVMCLLRATKINIILDVHNLAYTLMRPQTMLNQGQYKATVYQDDSLAVCCQAFPALLCAL